jgi:hypothetical protein
MFIAVLFTITKLWNQPRCLSTNEWIKKIWYLSTMEFYSAIQRKKIISFVEKWMELEIILLCKISQISERQMSYFVSSVDSRLKKMKVEGDSLGRGRGTERGMEDKRG